MVLSLPVSVQKKAATRTPAGIFSLSKRPLRPLSNRPGSAHLLEATEVQRNLGSRQRAEAEPTHRSLQELAAQQAGPVAVLSSRESPSSHGCLLAALLGQESLLGIQAAQTKHRALLPGAHRFQRALASSIAACRQKWASYQ